jgi:hypothetical protein
MGQLWSPVKALAEVQDSVHQRGARRGHVERADAAGVRKRDELVARAGYARAQALALGAENDHDPTAVVRPVVGKPGIGYGAVYPGVAPLCVGQPVGQVTDAGHGQVLHRSRGGLAHGRSHVRRAALREHHARATRRLGHAADGAQVVRVLDLVQAEHESIVGREQGIGLHVGIGLDLRADTLMIRGAAALLDLVPLGLNDLDTSKPDLAGGALGRVYEVDATPAPQGLAHWIAPVDDHARRTRRAPSPVSRISHPRSAS